MCNLFIYVSINCSFGLYYKQNAHVFDTLLIFKCVLDHHYLQVCYTAGLTCKQWCSHTFSSLETLITVLKNKKKYIYRVWSNIVRSIPTPLHHWLYNYCTWFWYDSAAPNTFSWFNTSSMINEHILLISAMNFGSDPYNTSLESTENKHVISITLSDCALNK